jgi:hypothetical protein
LATWFLVFLVLVWICVVLPGAERARRRTPLPQTIRFQRSVARFARLATGPGRRSHRVQGAAGRWVLAPHSDRRALKKAAFRRAQRRRRRVLVSLLALAGFSLIPAALLGGAWVEIHLLVDATLLFFVAALLEVKRRREERLVKVTPLRGHSVAGSDTQRRATAGR